tara:strand:+ start:385 stop:693 length:309 start_codon:yes stop_codon:yes gene_type:complete
MTGENKKRFRRWFKDLHPTLVNVFDSYPPEMQEGVIIAYYDSLDLVITIEVNLNYTYPFAWKLIYDYDYESDIFYPTRQEANTEAFKQADILMNEQLNKYNG